MLAISISLRNLSFEAILVAIESGCFATMLKHPKLKHQKILEVKIDDSKHQYWPNHLPMNTLNAPANARNLLP
jgi:hypothetical protein